MDTPIEAPSVPPLRGGEPQYIFSETEFDGDEFHAATFVAKYRRVTSLESLRDQLRAYGSGLKDQLYDTINHDYKDFIDIATKLDGVDSRVQHLKKPLIDLRIEALSLHDGVVTSLESIQQKLRKKSELRQRALLLDTILSCMSKFDDIDRLFAALDPPAKRSQQVGDHAGHEHSTEDNKKDGVTRRSDLVKFTSMREARRVSRESAFKKAEDKTKHQLTFQQTQYTKVLHVLRAQLLKASEQERAAHALASAKDSIALLSERLEQHATVVPAAGSSKLNRSDSITGSGKESSSASVAELRDRAGRQEAAVMARTHELLSQVLVSNASLQPASGSQAGEDWGDKDLIEKTRQADAAIAALRSRILAHLLRTLRVLHRGDVAQTILSENIVYPLARSVLSQGRVDGTGGRGFFAGLEEALMQILEGLASSPGVPDLLQLAMDTFHQGSNISSHKDDFLVAGVWKPVTAVLSERFHGMFSVGVAVAMHRAFSALERFALEIPRTLLARDSASATVAYARLCRHPDVVAFRNKWKLDLYFQLRRQEVTTRLEHAFSLLSPVGADSTRSITVRSDAAATMDLVYFSEQQTLQSAAPVGAKITAAGAATVITATPVVTRSVIPRTLAPDVAKSVVDDVSRAISGAGRTEKIYQQFKLPIVQAVVIEIASCLHPSVFLSPLAGPFLALVVQIFVRLEAQVCAAVPQITPPSFTNRDAVLKTLQSSASGNAPSNGSSVYNTVDDLVDLLCDLGLLLRWMSSELPHSISSKIIESGQMSGDASQALNAAVEKSLATQSSKMLALMFGVWTRLCAMVCADCKSGLQAVKGVAGKYRLTNKPPPELASPFVVTILNPLREFISRSGPNVEIIRHSMLEAGGSNESSEKLKVWQGDIVEDVTSAYLQQVQSLVETARQMDSVFMKRSKGATAATAANSSGAAAVSDSEKIALQMIFDINAFEEEIKSVGISNPSTISSFMSLHDQISEMKKLFQNLS